ncbi:MAG: hypothetical protein JWQ96_1388 [Segetibacter sp.]|nr:hypothetical protein [Segetibacter sp.]
MKHLILKRSFAFSAGLAAVLPCVYFLVSNLLNSELNMPLLWKPIAYIFEDPAKRSIGLNINLIILFGPVVTILLNLPQVVHASIVNQKPHTNLFITIQKFASNWSVIVVAGLCLAAVLFYLLGENCNCL